MIKYNNIIHIGVYMSNGTEFMYETMEGVARWKYRTVWGQVVNTGRNNVNHIQIYMIRHIKAEWWALIRS